MLAIGLIGLNHHTAPVELRECLAFSGDEAAQGLDRLRSMPSVREAVLISTCNRVEIVFASQSPDEAVHDLKRFLAEFKGAALGDFEPALYVYRGDDAVRHLFRVAASLDSMMVGEPQILGQIKEAFKDATGRHMSGVILNRLMHRTFFVAKRIRTETGIGDHAVSISYAAIELGRKIFGSLEGRPVLLIGAGEMAELAVEHLQRHRAGAIRVANRTFARGVELAGRFGGQAIRFEEVAATLAEVDIIISSTGAAGYILHRREMKAVMRSRRNRPLFFIDIAVPRDIDPKINRLHNCYVYDIDDLHEVVEENIEDRQREAVKGERIVDEAVIRFRQWYDSLQVVPTIVALRRKMETIAQAELKKTLPSLPDSSEATRQALQRLVEAMVNKTLHNPTVFLKREGGHGDKRLHLDVIRKVFGLEDSTD